MPADRQPTPPPHNHQFMRCKQTIRSNNALQVLSPTIPLLIGKLICHTITSNGMAWHYNSNEQTKKNKGCSSREKKKCIAKWKKNGILFRMRRHRRFPWFSFQIILHFRSWTIIPLSWVLKIELLVLLLLLLPLYLLEKHFQSDSLN